MTEKKNMVEIGGKKVLSREEAERAIRSADPEEVVRLAFCAASASAGGEGKAILDLATGEVCARAADPPPLPSADWADGGAAMRAHLIEQAQPRRGGDEYEEQGY